MKVLVVDDEKNIRDSIRSYLKLENIETVGVENGLAAKRLLQDQVFTAGIVDLRMPGMNGLELLAWIREQGPHIPLIMISAFSDVHDAVAAMKLGAQDYIVKPFDPEELVVRLNKIIENDSLKNQAVMWRGTEKPGLEQLGNTQGMRIVRSTIRKVADTPSTVLITGESGTGKDFVARLLHSLSSRSEGPFIPVNLGGIPEGLLESELFGHERGAFTGAEQRRIGMFEMASRGTLFLDEVGEMPLHLQVKLLRIIQDRKIQRLGSSETIPIDVRIVSATNLRLAEKVQNGLFREDLFYRLNVIHLELPPLRGRMEDIPGLAGNLVQKLNQKLGKAIKEISPEGLARLKDYAYPGNIRELENLIERAMIFAEADVIEASDLIFPESQIQIPPKAATLESLEREAVIASLHRWEGNRTKTAEELGITRRTLFNKIKYYGLDL